MRQKPKHHPIPTPRRRLSGALARGSLVALTGAAAVLVSIHNYRHPVTASPPPTHPPKPAPRRWVGVALALGGLLALTGSAAIIASIHNYKHHVTVVSQRLTKGVVTAEHQALITGQQTGRSCSAPPPSSRTAGSAARMILEIPAVGLVAPVLASDTDTALNSGIGHLPVSTWPDQGGTVILEAHDVTFFANLNKLRPGDTLVLDAPCRTWTYHVTNGTVIRQGAPLPPQTAPALVLVTCWPTNALYFTDHRYVVSATLTAVARSVLIPPRAPSFVAPVATLPAAVNPQTINADTMGVPEGTLTLATAIDPALRASATPLTAAASAIEVFDTCLLAEERHQPSWWTNEVNNVPYAAAHPFTAGPPTWTSPLEILLAGHGRRITSATLSAHITEQGVAYRTTVGLSTVDGRWLVTSWVTQPDK